MATAAGRYEDSGVSVSFRRKAAYTAASLLVFLVAGQLPLYGVKKYNGDKDVPDPLYWMNCMFASSNNTLMTLGIIPLLLSEMAVRIFSALIITRWPPFHHVRLLNFITNDFGKISLLDSDSNQSGRDQVPVPFGIPNSAEAYSKIISPESASNHSDKIQSTLPRPDQDDGSYPSILMKLPDDLAAVFTSRRKSWMATSAPPASVLDQPRSSTTTISATTTTTATSTTSTTAMRITTRPSSSAYSWLTTKRRNSAKPKKRTKIAHGKKLNVADWRKSDSDKSENDYSVSNRIANGLQKRLKIGDNAPWNLGGERESSLGNKTWLQSELEKGKEARAEVDRLKAELEKEKAHTAVLIDYYNLTEPKMEALRQEVRKAEASAAEESRRFSWEMAGGSVSDCATAYSDCCARVSAAFTMGLLQQFGCENIAEFPKYAKGDWEISAQDISPALRAWRKQFWQKDDRSAAKAHLLAQLAKAEAVDLCEDEGAAAGGGGGDARDHPEV
uniref:Retrotransposon protein, putative, Ty3-gypsy subclass n=1 Tax=Oryza sativa subsp. japonica TaxID=39947 RepID=H2KWX9_ORYSJ|nr:retrotransposon protein, putative, Ty3-gypsy subclass [Oryza sativa Japonica Group]